MLVKIMEQNKEEILTANSRDVAEHFEKDHKHVLESIRNLTAENSATKSMFYDEIKSFIQQKYTPMLMAG